MFEKTLKCSFSKSPLNHFFFPTKQMPRLSLHHVQALAYYKWQEAGCPEGQDLHFWNLAKEALRFEAESSSNALDESFIREFKDNVDWSYISSYQHLSEDFIREFQDKVDWNRSSAYQQLSEDFIREFQYKVDWLYISAYQKLSEDFIREFQDKVDWRYIPTYQQLSEDFIREFENRIDKKLIPKKLSREEKIEKLSPHYEIVDNKVIAYKSVRSDGYSFFNFRYLYEVGKTYESWCDCSWFPNSFGLSAWTKEKAIDYARTGFLEHKLFKVEVDLDDIGAIVHDNGKLRCFKIKIIEEVTNA